MLTFGEEAEGPEFPGPLLSVLQLNCVFHPRTLILKHCRQKMESAHISQR